MTTLRLVLGDQLTPTLATLRDASPEDAVLMAEVHEEATYVRHHKQKIVLVLAAMRHFASNLRDRGLRVDYVELDSTHNTGSLFGEVERAVRRHGCSRVVVTEPGEWRLFSDMQYWSERLGVDVEIRDDDRFLCSREEFADWAEGRKTLRMEHFYRVQRRRTGWLIDADGKPHGGKWNYDAENRRSLPSDVRPPRRRSSAPDEITLAVMELVERLFPDHFGQLDGFSWAVTREQALDHLTTFVDEFLPRFGDYQDAMREGDDWLFHSLLAPSIHLGLLTPRETCEAALHAYDQGRAPLNATEGFVRQILGWREFVRGIYWLKMPDYANSNSLDAHRPLPEFYWTARVEMNCLRECIDATRRNAYAHHIQRLMITGNFALLAGLRPREVEEWYLAVYADAYEWVELPNTHGMALFADGGVLASKPYAASGAYIDRMSDYCSHCPYDPKQKLGEGACPFNYLYWNFLIENEDQLSDNPRMGMPYRNLAKMSEERRAQITRESEEFLESLV